MIREHWSAERLVEDGAWAATGVAELPLDGTYPSSGAAHCLVGHRFRWLQPLKLARRMVSISGTKPYKTAG
jgi:hypothetical protein